MGQFLVDRIVQLRIFGNSPLGVFFRLSGWIWDHIPYVVKGSSSDPFVRSFFACARSPVGKSQAVLWDFFSAEPAATRIDAPTVISS